MKGPCEVQQVHDLTDACPRNVAEGGDIAVARYAYYVGPAAVIGVALD